MSNWIPYSADAHPNLIAIHHGWATCMSGSRALPPRNQSQTTPGRVTLTIQTRT